jgi:hypothetical protein
MGAPACFSGESAAFNRRLEEEVRLKREALDREIEEFEKEHLAKLVQWMLWTKTPMMAALEEYALKNESRTSK